MDVLACKVGEVVHDESAWDAAHACAVVSVYAITQSTDTSPARWRRLEALFVFMRDVLRMAEAAEKGPLQ